MKRLATSIRFNLIALIITALSLSACNNQNLPDTLAGTYSGNNGIIVRYNKDGQYIFYEDKVEVSIEISKTQLVTGRVGGAIFEDCKIVKNRGWISRQLNIKTDYLISGRLLGSTFKKDSITDKNISIPFNIENGEIKGSLFLTETGQQFPLISFLKLKKQ